MMCTFRDCFPSGQFYTHRAFQENSKETEKGAKREGKSYTKDELKACVKKKFKKALQESSSNKERIEDLWNFEDLKLSHSETSSD